MKYKFNYFMHGPKTKRALLQSNFNIKYISLMRFDFLTLKLSDKALVSSLSE